MAPKVVGVAKERSQEMLVFVYFSFHNHGKIIVQWNMGEPKTEEIWGPCLQKGPCFH